MSCIRCKKEDEVGFCIKCYMEVYGLDKTHVVAKKMDDLICSEKHLKLVERDSIYTDEIRQSIIKDGLKNALIIDNKNRILIGHHRYFICKELGWERIGCYIINDPRAYNKFIEGGVNNIFIIRIDGEVKASYTEIEDFLPLLRGWILKTPFWKTSHLVLEAFTGIGASNDEENWKERNQTRTKKFGGGRNLNTQK